MMVVVDTSVWLAAFREPSSPAGEQLGRLLDEDLVVLPAPVRIELLAGTGRQTLPRMVRNLSALPHLVPVGSTWSRVETWACDAAAAGERFGLVDLLIAAVAAEEGASVWSADHAFARMAARGWVKLLESEA